MGQATEGFSDDLMDLRGELAQVNLSPNQETLALLTELYILAGDIKVVNLICQFVRHCTFHLKQRYVLGPQICLWQHCFSMPCSAPLLVQTLLGSLQHICIEILQHRLDLLTLHID